MRKPTSPWRYDRATIRLVLETQGRDEALRRWPIHAVDPIARVLGLTGAYNNRRAWKAEWTPLLGTKPDCVLAGELGLPVSTVCVTRRRLGIPQCDVAKYREVKRKRLASISDSDLAGPLDTLAPMYGVSIVELMGERKRRTVRPRKRTGQRDLLISDMRAFAVNALRAAFPEASLQQIGEAVGVTRERVRQIDYLANVAVAS